MTSDHCNVLLTFAGRKSYQYLALKASPRAGVVVAADADPHAPIRVHGAPLETVPRVSQRDAYLNALDACITRHKIDCVIPLNDLDVSVLSESTGRFAALGARYLGAPADATRALCDKHAAATWLESRGFRTPATWTFEEAASHNARQTDLTCISKARFGQGSEGFRVIRTDEEFQATPADHVVQPFINGIHFNLDVLRGQDGSVLSVVPKRKLEMQGGTAALVRSEARQDLIDLGVQLGAAIQHVGVIDVDIIDVDGELHVLEINPRMGGCFPFACIVCPAMSDALLAVGRGETPAPFLGAFQDSVTMFREWRYLAI